jgi:hypothetical protein
MPRKEHNSKKKVRRPMFSLHRTLFVGIFVATAIPLAYAIPGVFTVEYQAPGIVEGSRNVEVIPEKPIVLHLDTPVPLRAIYMSQCVVGTPSFRDSLVKLIDETELNAVVIDIKDYTGKLGFSTDNPLLMGSVSDQCGARDMYDFIKRLHAKGIYTIARITVFQDPYYTELRPDLAVKKASDKTTWNDYKGLAFVDVGARDFWDYIIEISKEAYALGFDELNYDYIRFPSDGPMKDVYYSHSQNVTKADQLEHFFAYLNEQLTDKTAFPEGRVPVLSADIFGMTTTNTDDLNIGQVLERTLPYFDYISPMVYPSHYPQGFNNWSNPNQYPYEIVKFSMSSAVARAIATTTSVYAFVHTPLSTTTPIVFEKPAYEASKLRPWLQDFDYGGNYDIEEVQAQMRATYDSGLDSWMLWDPSNRYTRGALGAE